MTSERLRKNQNKIKNSDDEDVVLACATKTLVCAAKTEHLLKKKAKKKHVGEELAYGKREPIQIYCKNSFCRIVNISESIWV